MYPLLRDSEPNAPRLALLAEVVEHMVVRLLNFGLVLLALLLIFLPKL